MLFVDIFVQVHQTNDKDSTVNYYVIWRAMAAILNMFRFELSVVLARIVLLLACSVYPSYGGDVEFIMFRADIFN
ncbi:unnamed protein product [Colias eurytheme]|nr:unnamed protein product [Colias eurytheme]